MRAPGTSPNANVPIPYQQWTPLSVTEVVTRFANAPLRWCLAGGCAVEQFLGFPIREHSDIDIVIFRDEQRQAQRWLKGWRLYAADPPGTLRPWLEGEALPFGIHDIWGHQQGSTAWQLQIMLAEVERNEWVSRRDPRIRGRRDDLIAIYNGVPCVRIDVQLLYKAKQPRPKDELDFQASLPRLSVDEKQWLKDKLCLLHPSGHPWLDTL